MCENNANKSVKQALINNGFKENSDGNLERVLDGDESLMLWKYLGLNTKFFYGQKARIQMLRNGTADAYIPKYIVEREVSGTIISDPSDVDKFNKEIFDV